MLKELLDDHQLFHSKFQQDQLITTKGVGTPYGQYKQSLRELYKRVRGYREDVANRDQLIVDIDELEWELENSELDQFEARRKEIELKRKIALLEESERLVKETAREGKRFYQQAVALKNMIGELTSEKREKLDREMWVEKIKWMGMIDVLTKGRVGTNSLEFAMALDGVAREEVKRLFQNPAELEKDVEKNARLLANNMAAQMKELPELKISDFFQLVEENDG